MGYSDANCVDGDVVIGPETRARLEYFEGVEQIRGSLLIADEPGLISIGPLNQLREVTGHVSLTGLILLENLDGLEALESVGAQLVVSDNPGLLDLQGLDQVQSVGAVAYISKLDLNVTDIAPLPLLESAAGLRIEDVGGIETLLVPGAQYQVDLVVSNNADLVSLNSRDGISTSGVIAVIGNDNLTEVSGFAKCDCDTADLLVSHNRRLAELSGFGNVTMLSGVTIAYNEVLRSISAGAGLREVTSITIVGNPALVELPGLSDVAETSALFFYGNTAYGDDAAQQFLEKISEVDYAKVGANSTSWLPLEPCPWLLDRTCDEATTPQHPFNTGLCSADPDDCAEQ